jgi:tetratricopeptide (TPR) repeat protein
MAYSVESKSNNPANALRDALEQAERQAVQLTAQNVERFLLLLDRIEQTFETLDPDGIDLRPEETRWQSLLIRLDTKPQALVGAAAKAGGLAKLRAKHQPAESFWWHLDAALAQRRRQAARRFVLTLVTTLIVVVGGYYTLNAIFPPNPAAVRMIEFTSALETLIATGQWDEALRLVEQAQAELPDEVELVLWEVVLARQTGDDVRVADAFARAQALLPDRQPELWVQLGNFYLQAGDLAGANAAGAEAAALAPENPQVTFLLGNLAEAQGDIATAITMFENTFTYAEQDNPQLAVIARVRMGNLLQRAPAMESTAPLTDSATLTDTAPLTPSRTAPATP